MKRLIAALLAILCASSITWAMQCGQATTKASSTPSANANTKKRGPIFRATKDQVKQAQAILKERSFYMGEQTGKLDTDTRTGLKKYQEAEGIKITGTLNKATLEKMGIALTERQKLM
jgi:peptidoglycan hydrolase-like protein with peptidoglycan-binding domain